MLICLEIKSILLSSFIQILIRRFQLPLGVRLCTLSFLFHHLYVTILGNDSFSPGISFFLIDCGPIFAPLRCLWRSKLVLLDFLSLHFSHSRFLIVMPVHELIQLIVLLCLPFTYWVCEVRFRSRSFERRVPSIHHIIFTYLTSLISQF